MKFEISFVHMNHTEALDRVIREKSSKLSKFLQKNPKLKWTCYVKEKLQYAELQVMDRKTDFFAKAGTPSLYKSIDQVIAKIEKQLIKKKEKITSKIQRGTKITVEEKE